jgi:hypothetical protein
MAMYGLFDMASTPQKFTTLVKGLKFKNAKSTFHLLLLFEQESPIGLL